MPFKIRERKRFSNSSSRNLPKVLPLQVPIVIQRSTALYHLSHLSLRIKFYLLEKVLFTCSLYNVRHMTNHVSRELGDFSFSQSIISQQLLHPTNKITNKITATTYDSSLEETIEKYPQAE